MKTHFIWFCVAVAALVVGTQLGKKDMAVDAPAKKPTIQSAPRTPKPTDLAVTSSLAYLDSLMGKGNYEVVSAVGVMNDMEATNVSYPITTMIEIRFRGPSPTGFVKRTATFACLADGRVIQPLQLPSI